MNVGTTDLVMRTLEQIDYLMLSLKMMLREEKYEEMAVGMGLLEEWIGLLRLHLETEAKPGQ